MYYLPTPRPLRAAIVGPGYIGRVHAETLRRMGVEVRVLIGRDPERTRAAADELGVAQISTDLAPALADPAIDVIHVCTPNHLHYGQALAALRAGKHLVCEKPLTITPEESAALVAAAGPRQVAAVCYCYRHYPLVQHLRAMVAAGELGPVHHVSGAYLTDENSLPTDYNVGMSPDLQPSFAMADIGVHWCDLAEHVTGQRITELVADFQTVVPERVWRPDGPGHGPCPANARPLPGGAGAAVPMTMEDSLTLLLRFSGGARGTAHISKVSPGHKNWIQLDLEGREAASGWNQEEPNTLEIRRRGPGNVRLPRDAGALAPAVRTQTVLPPGHPEGYNDAFYNLLRPVYEDVVRAEAGAPLAGGYPTLADGHRSMVLVQAVLESVRTGGWVRVPQ